MSTSRMKIASIFAKLFLTFAVFLAGQYLLLGGADPAQDRGVGGVGSLGVGQYRASWAVVIGINEYGKAPRLNYAVNDARSVVAAVQKLGFASDKILLLLDHEATKQRIEQLLYGTLRRASSEDRVFVFFAGHGMTAALPRGGEEGFILPVDGDPEDLPLTAIAMEDLRRIARRIPAKHILFAMDACYSGFAITRDVRPTNVDMVYLERVTKEPAVQIITAGRKDEPVVEEEGHGLFTRRMLSGLTGLADTDQNGVLTAQELAMWLESRVARDSQAKQHPQYSRLDGEGQFVFLMPGRERPVVASVQSEREKLSEEMKRLVEEAERLKRERALFEEQRKLQEAKQRIEMAKFEAERALFKAETERFTLERAQTEKTRLEVEEKRKAEEQAKMELARLETDRARLQAQEEKVVRERASAEAARLEAERRSKQEEVTVHSAPEIVAKATTAEPARISVPLSSLPKSAEVPRLSVGDSWTVKFDDGRTATRTVRGIEQGQYVFDWGLDLIRYYDGDLVLRRQETPEDNKEVRTALLRRKILTFPLAVDKSWEFDVVNYSAGAVSERRVFTFKVLGIELVTTPAGTFPAFKIEEHSVLRRSIRSSANLPQDIRGTLGIRYWWYSPDVKFPVRVATVIVPRWSGESSYSFNMEQDYELAAFNIRK